MILNPPASWYELTLPIVCTENLIMGLTLLLLCMSKRVGRVYHRIGVACFAIAMLMVSLLNLLEYLFGKRGVPDDISFAFVIFAASIQLFIFLYAFISMLDPVFITCRRIAVEFLLIILFTVPVLFISSTENPIWFDTLFLIGLAFYIVKLILSIYVYKRCLRKATSEIENYYSRDSSTLLYWINHTFSVVVVVGVISVIVPMTNLVGLALYNVFVFIAYLYIYIQIIRNIRIFDDSMRKIESLNFLQKFVDTHLEDNSMLEIPQTKDEPFESPGKSISSFLLGREKVYEHLLAQKTYCNSGITADDIAAQLNTNRNRLSIFLKKEQNKSYYEWIAHLRIEEAKRLLIQYPELPLSEIALRVGIEDKSNFGRVFKRFEGVSPAVYRQEHFALSR